MYRIISYQTQQCNIYTKNWPLVQHTGSKQSIDELFSGEHVIMAAKQIGWSELLVACPVNVSALPDGNVEVARRHRLCTVKSCKWFTHREHVLPASDASTLYSTRNCRLMLRSIGQRLCTIKSRMWLHHVSTF